MKQLAYPLIALALIACLTLPAAGAENKLSSGELKKALVGKSFTLRQAQNVAARQYYKIGPVEYLCRHKLSGLFPSPQDLPGVIITRVTEEAESEVLKRTTKYEGGRFESKELTKGFRFWAFTLKHPHLGKGEFRLTRANGDLPESLDEVLGVLGFVLAGEGLPQRRLFRARQDSKLVHFIGSGHAPEGEGRVEFGSLEEAKQAGHVPCALCFNGRVRLAYAEVERQLGRETEATLHHYYQLSRDALLQERVERLGRKVLANWPTRLIGYDYRFNVIESREFEAAACAGGYIFVHSGLLDLVESDQELEAVLAHNIAHVEQRHAIKQLLRAKREANAAAFLGVLLSSAAITVATTASAKDLPLAAAGVEAAAEFGIWMYCVGAQVALQGYSREHEMEADIYALNYFQKMGYDRRHLVSVIRKIRTSVDLGNPRSADEDNLSSSHPTPNNRIHLALTTAIDPWPEGVTFDVFNKEDELVYSMTFQGTCNYTRRDGSEYCKVLLEVSTTTALPEVKSVEGLLLSCSNQNQWFKADGSYDLVPMDRIGMAFTFRGKLPLTPESLSAPRLEGIEGVKVARRTTAK